MSSTKVRMVLTKKIIQRVSNSVPLYASPQISRASLSTAYERAEGSNAVTEGKSEDRVLTREAMYKAKQEGLDMTNDVAKEGPIKAEEGGDMVRDTAKDSMDGAWMAAKDASHNDTEGDRRH